MRVLLNGDKAQELCEGTLSIGHPLELTMDVAELSRVTVLAYLPERLIGVDRVLGIGNAEIGYASPQGTEPSCGTAFEPES